MARPKKDAALAGATRAEKRTESPKRGKSDAQGKSGSKSFLGQSVELGLVSLKSVSDAFKEKLAMFISDASIPAGFRDERPPRFLAGAVRRLAEPT